MSPDRDDYCSSSLPGTKSATAENQQVNCGASRKLSVDTELTGKCKVLLELFLKEDLMAEEHAFHFRREIEHIPLELFHLLACCLSPHLYKNASSTKTRSYSRIYP
jgi:hypothetical protein